MKKGTRCGVHGMKAGDYQLYFPFCCRVSATCLACRVGTVAVSLQRLAGRPGGVSGVSPLLLRIPELVASVSIVTANGNCLPRVQLNWEAARVFTTHVYTCEREYYY